MLPDELTETLRRTEALAIQSALALCLACELMERFNAGLPPEAEPAFNDLRDQVHRVGAALGTVLELVQVDDLGEGRTIVRHDTPVHRRLN